MHKMNIKKQMNKLYMVTSVGYFQIAGASWVALLALRGFSLLEIGMLESIFHIVSFCFELPTGVFADVLGRKKTLVLSQVASLVSGIFMILSNGFTTTAIAIGCNALSYNLASGTREALAYDSLKLEGKEGNYNRFASTEMMLYRISNSTATLCAGLALWLGYKRAYAIDIVFELTAVCIACSLTEVIPEEDSQIEKVRKESVLLKLVQIILESWYFLCSNKKARRIMVVNAFIGAVSTLVLFFLQAKLPMAGLHHAMLGPALFVMGLGAALGSKVVAFFPNSRYQRIILAAGIGVVFAFGMIFTGNPYLMILGGFVGAFADDFLEVRTDVILNDMIPSKQRATLISVSSFLFSVIMIVMSTVFGWVMNGI